MAGPASTTSLFSFFLCGAERIEPGSKRADVSIPRGKGSCNSVGQLGSAPFCWLQESDGRKEEEVVIRSIFRVMDCNKTFASSLFPPPLTAHSSGFINTSLLIRDSLSLSARLQNIRRLPLYAPRPAARKGRHQSIWPQHLQVDNFSIQK